MSDDQNQRTVFGDLKVIVDPGMPDGWITFLEPGEAPWHPKGTESWQSYCPCCGQDIGGYKPKGQSNDDATKEYFRAVGSGRCCIDREGRDGPDPDGGEPRPDREHG